MEGSGSATEHNPSVTAVDDVEATLDELLKKADVSLDAEDHLQVDVQDLLSISDDPPNLDLAITALRDALRGADGDDLTVLHGELQTIAGHIDTLEAKLQSLIDADAYDDVNDRRKVDVEATVLPPDAATESTLDAQLDITQSALRDALRGPSNKTLTDVISDLQGGSGKTLSTLETDVEALLKQARFNDVFGEVAAAPTTNTVLDRLRQIQETDFATETTLAAQLDITLSALRDALQGADGDDLTVLHGELQTIAGHVDTLEAKLQSLIDADAYDDVDDRRKVDVEATVLPPDAATESTLAGQLDITQSALRDALRGPSNKTLTDVISDLQGGSGKTLSTLETDVEALLEQARFNAVFGEVAAAPTANTVLDRLRQIQETDFATETTLAAQLDITLSALRDALQGADGDDLTVLHSALESLLTELQGKADQGEAQAIQNPPNLDAQLSSRASEATLDQITPEDQADVFDHAIAADTDILANEGTGALSPSDSPTHFRVFVALDTSTVFSAMIDQGGATTHELDQNAGTALQAGALYRFTVPVRQGDNVDFQTDDACTILRLTVDEVTAAL